MYNRFARIKEKLKRIIEKDEDKDEEKSEECIRSTQLFQ